VYVREMSRRPRMQLCYVIIVVLVRLCIIESFVQPVSSVPRSLHARTSDQSLLFRRLFANEFVPIIRASRVALLSCPTVCSLLLLLLLYTLSKINE